LGDERSREERAGMSLAYEQLRQVTPLAGVVLAGNPSAMTLDGTNTWLLRDEPSRRQAVVVDPGPDEDSRPDRCR
jgi:glyoxylase-like metal-dependent hydrolase (beta-lactamase superfamily II)